MNAQAHALTCVHRSITSPAIRDFLTSKPRKLPWLRGILRIINGTLNPTKKPLGVGRFRMAGRCKSPCIPDIV